MAYFTVFIISILAIAIIFSRRYASVRLLTADELMGRLITSSSVRSDLSNRYVIPAIEKIKSFWLGMFWMSAEKILRALRSIVQKIEARLKYLSENMRGRHVNLVVGEKTEYWQTLNGARPGREGEKENVAEDTKNTPENGE